jgi:hypothetical protein
VAQASLSDDTGTRYLLFFFLGAGLGLGDFCFLAGFCFFGGIMYSFANLMTWSKTHPAWDGSPKLIYQTQKAGRPA